MLPRRPRSKHAFLTSPIVHASPKFTGSIRDESIEDASLNRRSRRLWRKRLGVARCLADEQSFYRAIQMDFRV